VPGAVGDYWGEIAEDDGAARLAAVIIAIMAARPGDNAERYDKRPSFTPAADRNRPHP
jgi:hypothetical protein